MGITRFGTPGRDTILGTTTDDKLYGLNGDDTLNGLTGNDTLYGGAGNDLLRGDEGILSFYGGAGNDTLSTGGTASMTAYFGRGDGQDLITGHPDWASTVNTLQFTGLLTKNDIAVSVSGTALVLSIRGSTDSVTIERFYNYGPPMAEGSNIGGGMTGVQVVRFANGTSWSLADLKALVFAGTSGNDAIRGSYLADTITAGDGSDTLHGLGGDDVLDGGAGNDSMVGGSGNDTLDGGAGDDTMLGGNGNDLYIIDSPGDVASETGTGFDSVSSAIDYTLGAKIESLDLMRGMPAALRGTGNALNNILTGNEFNNLLHGGDGDDQLNGGDGNDILDAGTGDNRLHGGAGHDTLIGSNNGADALDGDSGDDWLNGLAGNDTLDGGLGNDTLYGGAGNDWLDAGIDWSKDHLGSSYLDGGAGNDTLGGDRGADVLLGGDGNDLISGNGGDDTLDGGSGNDTLDGNEGTLSFHGAAGNDTISSGAKASMTAYFGRGDGRDVIIGHLVVDSVVNTLQFTGTITKSDIAITTTNGSLVLSIRGTTDAVEIGGFYAMGSSVYGSLDVGGRMTGVHRVQFADGSSWTMANIKDIIFAGTPGNDTIQGSSGADTISGGPGHDDLLGDAGNDFLDGGAGNDTLSGGGGLNTLVGGTGNDRYVLDMLTDTIVESIDGGIDTVIARQGGYTLGDNLENLMVDAYSYSAEEAASRTFTGTGNALNNMLEGNMLRNALYGLAGNDLLLGHDGMDTLYGGNGHDTLTGGAGNDTLNGAMGNDTYLFGRGDGSDLLQDVDRTLAEVDVLQFLPSISREQVWLRKAGNHLEVSVIGTGDTVTVQHWYSGSAFHIEQFRTADGRVLLDTQVNQLVSAMAAFAPPAAGQTTLTAAYQAVLNPVIATSWT